MPLTGTRTPKKASTPAQAAKKGRALLTEILDQLDTEWETLKQDSIEMHGHDEAGLLAYYHSVLQPALRWINGDPYTVRFPNTYQDQRLASMCRWLTSLQDKEGQPVKEARERMVQALRQAYPPFRDLAYPDMPNDWPHGTTDWEVPPYADLDAMAGLWNSDDPTPADDRAQYLPTFRYRATEDFHLAALALLFLNKQCRYYLTDLHPHQTSDGRN